MAALFTLLASHSGAAVDTELVEAEHSRLRVADLEQMLGEEQTLLRVSDSIRRAGSAFAGRSSHRSVA